MTERVTFKGTVTREGRNIRGFVQLAGTRTKRNGEWVSVDPAALVKADASDAIARYNHDPDKILGRVKNGTVEIERTDQGIGYLIKDVPETSYANDTLVLLDGGYIDGSSFEIGGHLRSTFSTDPDGTRVRTYTSIGALVDVSPVIDPAFPSTAAAFGKDHTMTDVIEEQTETTPISTTNSITFGSVAGTITAAPIVTDDLATVTERFARTLDRPRLESAMDALMAESGGQLKGNLLTEYRAFAKVHAEFTKVDTDETEDADRFRRVHNMRLGRVPKAPANASGELFASDEYAEAFGRYIRGDGGRGMEQFAQSIAGDGTQGGYMVPDDFLNRLVERRKAYGGIASVAETLTTSDGRPLRWPTVDDTGNSAVIAAEGTAAGSAGADKVIGNNELGAFSYDATGTGNLPLLVSKELIQDSAFGIENWLADNLGARIGRKMAVDFATGSGSGEPLGLMSKTPDVMTATKTLAALIEHEFQIDPAYRDNAVWVMSDTTLVKYRGAVDNNGRPLWQPEASSGMETRPGGFLSGYRVVIDNAAGNYVAFGDIKAGYIIRYVRGIQLDVDPYTNIKTRQVAFHAWARADATVNDAYAYSVSSYSGVTADVAS